MKKSKNPVGKDFYSLTVTADYFLNRRFKNSLAGEKFAFSGFRLGSLNWSFDGRFIGAVARCFGSLAALDGSLSGFNNGTKSNRDLDAETLGYSKRAGGFAARTLWTGVDDRIAAADCSGGSGMCKRGDRYRNANGFFLVKRRFTGFCGTAGRSAYGQAGSCLTAAEKTEIDWADRIRSDKRKADLHLTIHFIQWEIEFQSRTSGWRIRMLDCFEFYIFTPDYVLRFSVDYDRNIQDIFLRDRAADIKQEMA